MNFLGMTWHFKLTYIHPETIKLTLNLIDEVFARFTTAVKSVDLLEVDFSRNGGREE
uniref:Uncharacterized protein n=1 Tax=Pristionchus pacificus TaxID=54126 RepID=A0A2A6BXU6_PRIPA|eukprot:PDM70708.1 hypothetical protein PRIPAC_43913 [Pristionchus pacificus]